MKEHLITVILSVATTLGVMQVNSNRPEAVT